MAHWENVFVFIGKRFSSANMGLLHWLLLSSDPIVTEARGWPKKPINPLNDDAKALLFDVEADHENSGSEDEE